MCVFLDSKIFIRAPTKYFLCNDFYYFLIVMEFKKMKIMFCFFFVFYVRRAYWKHSPKVVICGLLHFSMFRKCSFAVVVWLYFGFVIVGSFLRVEDEVMWTVKKSDFFFNSRLHILRALRLKKKKTVISPDFMFWHLGNRHWLNYFVFGVNLAANPQRYMI